MSSASEELTGARVALPDRAGGRGWTLERADRVRAGLQPSTVGRWRGRFARRVLDGLHDDTRPGKPRMIGDSDVERVIVKTLEEQPANATRWSTRSMAAATRMSQSAVSRIWRAFGLKPHRTETFKLSPYPQFIDKVRDVVGLYLNSPEAAVVLCVDEKSQIQALDRSQPVLPLMPGVPARQCHDYVSNGTTNLYAALDVASGQVLAEMTPRRTCGTAQARRNGRRRRTRRDSRSGPAAIEKVQALLDKGGPTNVVDDVYTSLHGHLLYLCDGADIDYGERNDPTTALLKKLYVSAAGVPQDTVDFLRRAGIAHIHLEGSGHWIIRDVPEILFPRSAPGLPVSAT